jgi:hypothetical protein
MGRGFVLPVLDQDGVDEAVAALGDDADRPALRNRHGERLLDGAIWHMLRGEGWDLSPKAFCWHPAAHRGQENP